MGFEEQMAASLTGTVILNILVLLVLVPVLIMYKREHRKKRSAMGKVLSFRNYRRKSQ